MEILIGRSPAHTIDISTRKSKIIVAVRMKFCIVDSLEITVTAAE
jgi:hypothetical protein